jgi:putative Ca2+/H+ antiporter (TMEM165/GDT1 family)
LCLHSTGVFIATDVAFFIAAIGDKTQIVTIPLAAAYSRLDAVVAGIVWRAPIWAVAR